MPPRCGCHLTVADEAFFHNALLVIIRPMPAAFTFSGGKNFDLRTVDKVGHKGGLTIAANPSSDGRHRRLTKRWPASRRMTPLWACYSAKVSMRILSDNVGNQNIAHFGTKYVFCCFEQGIP